MHGFVSKRHTDNNIYGDTQLCFVSRHLEILDLLSAARDSGKGSRVTHLTAQVYQDKIKLN